MLNGTKQKIYLALPQYKFIIIIVKEWYQEKYRRMLRHAENKKERGDCGDFS